MIGPVFNGRFVYNQEGSQGIARVVCFKTESFGFFEHLGQFASSDRLFFQEDREFSFA